MNDISAPVCQLLKAISGVVAHACKPCILKEGQETFKVTLGYIVSSGTAWATRDMGPYLKIMEKRRRGEDSE